MTETEKIKDIKVNSFFVAIFICVNSISWVIDRILPISNIIFSVIAFILISMLIRHAIKGRTVKSFFGSVNVYQFAIVFVITFFFIITFFGDKSSYTSAYLKSFILYGFTAFILSNKEYNIKLIARYIMYIGIFPICMIILTKDYNNMEREDYYGYLMGLSYGFLPIFISALFSLFNDKKIHAKLLALFIIVSLFSFYTAKASRGALAAVLAYVILYLFFHKKITRLRIFIFILLAVITVIGLANTAVLAKILQYIVDKLKINSFAINKTIELMIKNDISNGRLEIWANAIKDIHFLYGNGIGVFEQFNDGYVHNIVLQLAYEFGILNLLLFIGTMGIVILKKRKFFYDNRDFLIYLICIAIVELMFSSSFWLSNKFWFLLCFVTTADKKESKIYLNNKGINIKSDSLRRNII